MMPISNFFFFGMREGNTRNGAISNVFTPYEQCSSNKRVHKIDGTLLAVVGKDNVKIAPICLLTHMYYMCLNY